MENCDSCQNLLLSWVTEALTQANLSTNIEEAKLILPYCLEDIKKNRRILLPTIQPQNSNPTHLTQELIRGFQRRVSHSTLVHLIDVFNDSLKKNWI